MIKDMVKYVIEYDTTNMMSYTYETRHCVEEFGDDLDNFCLRAKRIRDDKDKRNIECYKVFCEKAQAEGRLPAIVEKEDPDFSEIFNVMDEGDFIIYSEKRCGKRMTYEVISVTNYWGSNYKK